MTSPPDGTGIVTVIPSLTGLFRLRFCVFFAELVDAAFGVDELLFAGKEGMADRADVEPDALLGGPGLVFFAASAADRGNFIVRVNSLFHGSTPPEYS